MSDLQAKWRELDAQRKNIDATIRELRPAPGRPPPSDPIRNRPGKGEGTGAGRGGSDGRYGPGGPGPSRGGGDVRGSGKGDSWGGGRGDFQGDPYYGPGKGKGGKGGAFGRGAWERLGEAAAGDAPFREWDAGTRRLESAAAVPGRMGADEGASKRKRDDGGEGGARAAVPAEEAEPPIAPVPRRFKLSATGGQQRIFGALLGHLDRSKKESSAAEARTSLFQSATRRA